jgi:hypothetical protein
MNQAQRSDLDGRLNASMCMACILERGRLYARFGKARSPLILSIRGPVLRATYEMNPLHSKYDVTL